MESLEALLPLVKTQPEFQLLECVFAARIPILKLRFAGSVDVDLSCQNYEAVRNSILLRGYTSLHPLVSDVILAVKLWAKSEKIVGAPSGHLSSYAWSLLAIYYLHSCAGLDCLDVEVYTKKPVLVCAQHWEPTLTLTELLVGFFRFYGWDFAWGSEVASIRLGVRSSRTHELWRKHRNFSSARLHLQDPFLLDRNLNCTLELENEAVVLERIQATWRRLQMDGRLLANELAEGAGEAVPSLATSLRLLSSCMDKRTLVAQQNAIQEPVAHSGEDYRGVERAIECSATERWLGES